MDGYEVAIWCCAITMTGGFIMLAWMFVLDEIRWRRRWRIIGRIPREPGTIEEWIASQPVARFYWGPDPRSMDRRMVFLFWLGRNWGANEGDAGHRFWLEVYWARGWTYRHLVGPFVDSSAWTGRALVPPCDVYRPESARSLRLAWGLIP